MRFFLVFLALFAAAPALAQGRVAVPSGSGDRANPIGSSTIAQPPANIVVEPVAMMIAAFDADGDGRVTRDEFNAGLRRSFEAASPRDGTIGYIGFADWAERWLGDRNALPSAFETDRDGDNRISFDELAGRFDLLFARFDADKDGVLVRRELVTIRQQTFDPRLGPRGKRERPLRK